MKRHLLLIPMILATTAALADAQTTAPSTPADAQAQAAALLSRPHALGAAKSDARSLSPSPVSNALDAHESAAALLSGARPRNRVNAVAAVARIHWRTCISGRTSAGSSATERLPILYFSDETH